MEESIGAVILESRREEDNLARKERYHCRSMDGAYFEGMDYGTDETPETVLSAKEEDRHLYDAFQQLSEVQRRRLMMLAGGMSIREIARQEGTNFRTVHESVESGRKNLKVFLKNTPSKQPPNLRIVKGIKSCLSEIGGGKVRHILKISVSKEPASGGIVSCRSVSVRERFLRFLLGEKRRLTIIVPGDSVRELAVSEVMEGGNVHGKSEVTA